MQYYLDEFAIGYNELIKEINDSWVRIRKKQGEQGLIEIAIGTDHYNVLGAIIKEQNVTFNDFAAILFQTFFSRLENGLELIRIRLNQEAKERALALVDKLEAGLLLSNIYMDALLNSVRELRVSLPLSIDKIISWFRPTTENSSESLRFDYIMQITVDMAKHYNPMFRADIEFETTGDRIINGLYVNAFNWIFMILFQNVIRRAGLGDNPYVKVQCIGSEGFITCKVINNIGLEVDIESVISNTNNIMQRCADGTYKDRVRHERGTGIYRIYDMLKHAMKFEPNLQIQVSSERVFEISFNLPVVV